MSDKVVSTTQTESVVNKVESPENLYDQENNPAPVSGLHDKSIALPPQRPSRQAQAWVQRILNMQSVVGNRAVQRLLSPRNPVPRVRKITSLYPVTAQRVIQRQVLSKLNVQTIDGTPPIYMLWDVVIAGRTPSPFSGTMGAHSTAWVAHIDQVRRHIINMPLTQAVEAMAALAQSELNEAVDAVDGADPTTLYQLKGKVDPKQQTLIEEAKQALTRRVNQIHVVLGIYNLGVQAVETDNSVAPPDAKNMMTHLRLLINDYLTFVNYLPGSTVKGGDPAGHGEGSARGDINAFEYLYALTSRQNTVAQDNTLDPTFTNDEKPYLDNAIEKLSNSGMGKEIKAGVKNKFDRTQCASLIDALIENLWGLFAAETPDTFAAAHSIPRIQAWRLMLKNFLKTIRTAYPYTFDFTAMHTAAQQIIGLRKALAEAKITLDSTFEGQLLTDITTNALSDETEVRDTNMNAEVAHSDIYQSGTDFQSTILLDDKTSKISDIDMIGAIEAIGRTKSPFSGTMGAHSTAWTAHIDAIKRLLVHKTLDEALTVLTQKAQTALNDPSLDLVHQINEKHQIFLIGAYNDLNLHVGQLETYKKLDSMGKTQTLETMIKAYLTYMNFLPLSTVETGSVPGGRSEGKHRGFLNSYEEYGIQAIPSAQRGEAKALLLEHLWGLYDPGAARAFPPSLGQREDTDYEKFVGPFKADHPLHAKIHSNTNVKGKKQQISLDRFFHTMLEAYPRSATDSDLVSSVNTRVTTPIASPTTSVEQDERLQLEGLIAQNNCLINAINKAANGDDATVTYAQMLEIRLRIGEIGTMLLATPRTINIILNVLGLNRGVIVVYPGDIPAEDFGNTEVNPIMIQHTGHAHFIPYVPDPVDTIIDDESDEDTPLTGAKRTKPPKRDGSPETKRLRSSTDTPQ